ncbi:MAG: TonB-dependent receptor [Xanthomonadales bacterium]|nr:TonB-dependent receptor [Xanthomonadales bacterium]
MPLFAGQPDNSDDEDTSLELVEVVAQRVANLQPASTYATSVTRLRFDPQIDIQARGLPEGQADVSIRGGLFENTSFKLGAVTIFDPQTGHYASELPIDPDMLTPPELLTDSQNSIHTFNATLATLSYAFADIKEGGAARIGFGTDALRFLSARTSRNKALAHNRLAGLSLSAAASSGDGTLPFGDHEFKRFAGHLQLLGDNQQSNVIFGYQDKFFGWPGAYTGFASLPETDHVTQGLVVMDHRQSGSNGWWQLAGAYRWLLDDYDFDRRTVESGGPGSFEHETRSFSVGINGAQSTGNTEWNYSVLLAADRLVSSTDLVNGFFNSRTYLSISLAPGWWWSLDSGAALHVTTGVRADLSNRDEDILLPLGNIRWTRSLDNRTHSVALDVSRSSQLPGYTALNSRPTGLFGGNPDLGRELSTSLTISYDLNAGAWHTRATWFVRHDDDLVDWTFRQGAPFARQANPVDLDVTGVEFLLEWTTGKWYVTSAYTFIDKDADYGTAEVDASYYALNFARHRATLAIQYKPSSDWAFRFDNECRLQQDNPLRNSERRAWLSAFSVSWKVPVITNLRLDLVADNLTNSDFEEFPGTPAYGRQLGLALNLDW